MTTVPKKTGGGSAAGGGFDYQNRVAAWLAVRILAESAVAAPWSLTDTDTTLEFIRCETDQPVDDILALTSKGGFLFFQVKKNVDLSKKSDSSIASAASQFVSQYLASRSDTNKATRLWDRSLDPTFLILDHVWTKWKEWPAQSAPWGGAEGSYDPRVRQGLTNAAGAELGRVPKLQQVAPPPRIAGLHDQLSPRPTPHL